MKDDLPELTAADFARAIPRRVRERIMRGEFTNGGDVAALRRFTGLSQRVLRENVALAG
jgi:hypothetical protein